VRRRVGPLHVHGLSVPGARSVAQAPARALGTRCA
jgi:hypothetical protein